MSFTDRKAHEYAAFARRRILLTVGSVPINTAGVEMVAVTPYQGFPTPLYALYGWLVETVQYFCVARVATANIELRVNAVSSSVLTGPSQPTAGAVTFPGLQPITQRKFKYGDRLGVVVTSDGTGTITNLLVTVTIRPFPLDGEAT